MGKGMELGFGVPGFGAPASGWIAVVLADLHSLQGPQPLVSTCCIHAAM